jgi:predicted MFS family arabinose efflux permease
MGGAFAAPIMGRLADRGLIRPATVGLMVMAGVTFYAMGWAAALATLAPLVLLTILFDAAIQGNQVLSQRILFSGSAEARGRINAIYMTTQFFGGGLGSVAGTITYHTGGWMLTAGCGGAVGLAVLILFGTELIHRPAYRIADM